MRHGKKFNHLGRKTAHRSAMLSNMASSLIIHKRINTTVAKAKALKKYIEPILTKSKTDDTNSRRVVFSYLQDKESVTELFNTVAEKIASRPGGYTRIIKTGARLGDNAEMCMMELVDFNELLLGDEAAGKAKTRRSRRGGSSKAKTEAPKAEVKEEVVVAEDVVEEVKAEEAVAEEVVEETKAEETEVKAEETEEPKAEAKEEEKEDDKKKEE
ncbi:50S ribosomal protein L17 [Ekhidna sp.]|uniref:50S ribosomal protein L17 n=1 Tax=Ekhidna sp. TaxID=2608089 RepID=UPI00329A4E6C